MKKSALFLAVLFSLAVSALAGPYGAWSNYREVTINTTNSGGGANVTGTVTNVPVLVRLTNANDASGANVLSGALSGGADLRFTDASGNVALAYEIERWSSTAAEVWVRVPAVAGNANTTIRMYWGRSGVVSAASGAATFSGAGYVGVYHMNGANSAGENDALGQTNLTLAAGGSVTPASTSVSGAVGNARNLPNNGGTASSSHHHFVSGGNTPSIHNTVTLEAWVRATIANNNTTESRAIISHTASNGTEVLLRRNSNATNQYSVQGGGTAITSDVAGGDQNTWVHLVAVSTGSGNTWTLYKNGAQVATGAASANAVNTANPWYFGAWRQSGTNRERGWVGDLDELRIAGTAKSADYIKLSYQVQRSGATAVTLGTAQVVSETIDYSSWAQSATLPVNGTVAQSGGNIAAPVTDFPLLVRLDANSGAFDFNQAMTNGEDLRFTKSDGTRLYYQIEHWNQAAKTAAVWVKMDTVYPNNTQTIKMYWGKPGSVSESNGSAVFSNGFLGAWHMGDPTGTAQTAPRPNAVSPGTGNDATPFSLPVGYSVIDGIIGKADTLRGQGNSEAGDHFYLGNGIYSSNFSTGLTMSLWVKPTSYNGSGAFHQMLTIGNRQTGAGVCPSCGGNFSGEQSIWVGRVGSFDDVIATEALSGTSSGGRLDGHAQSIATGIWQHITMTLLGNTTNGQKLYRNGILIAQRTSSQAPVAVERGANFIGRATWNDPTLRGVVDEVRIAAGIRSADWVRLDYQSQRKGAAVITFPLSSISYDSLTAVYPLSVPIAPLAPQINGTAGIFSVSPSLPAGLSLDSLTGVIRGTPSAFSAAANYTVTATNVLGDSKQFVINIAVNRIGPSGFSYLDPTVIYDQARPIAANTILIDDGGEAPTYALSGLTPTLPAGLSLNATTGAITGTPSAASAAASFDVVATNAFGSDTATISITVLAPENLSGWDNVKTFNVNTTASGANATTDVDNLPVLVRLNRGHGQIFQLAKADGGDIRFSKPDGTPLPYEIERWNPADSSAAIWVLVDNVTGSSLTPIRIHYGNAGATSRSSGLQVFRNAAGFAGVWHLSGLAADSAFDATPNRYTGVSNGAVLDTAGAVGRGKFFNNNTAIFYQMPGTANSRLNFPEDANYTVSTWARLLATGTSRTMVSKDEDQYALELRSSGAGYEFKEHSGSGLGSDEIVTAPVTTTRITPVWQHIVGVRNGANQAIYVDGVLADNTISVDASQGGPRTLSDLFIGKNPLANNRPWNGALDEVQISSVARSADWIKLSHLTQSQGAGPVSDLNYGGSFTFGVNFPGAIAPGVTGTPTRYTISPALPVGLNLNPTTGVIHGATATAMASTPFTITAYGGNAWTATATLNISVSPDGENYASWTDTATLNLNTSVAGAGLAASQSGFPALVRLSNAHRTLFQEAKVDGSDIRFSTPDGAHLSYEIERWSVAPSDTAALIWVLLPSVTANGVTPVIIHWGNASANSKSQSSLVFGTGSEGNGFQAVWHMNNGGTGNENDATANAFNATATGAPTNVTAGALGLARGFANNTDGNQAATQYFTVPNSASSILSFPQFGSYTLSAWANLTAGTSNIHTIVGKSDWAFNLQVNGTPRWEGQEFENMVGWRQALSPAAPVTGVWNHVAFVRNGTAESLYVNGTLVTATTALGAAATTQRNETYNVGLGYRIDNTQRGWLGSLDEIRMANVARSADWLKLEYKNQKPGVMPVSGLAYSLASYSFPEESPVTVPAPTLVLGAATRYGVTPTLPTGLTLNANGSITGTPQDGSAAQAYTVTAYGDSAWSAATTFTLAVTTLAPAALIYPADPVTVRVGYEITPVAPTFTGTINSFVVSPSLPSGLSMSPSTGVIVGTPLAAAATQAYEIIGEGPDGKDTATLTITVTPADEDYSTWGSSRNITINTSSSGANVTGTVTNYPLLVRLGNAESHIFSQALANGADVRFTKANGVTRLPHEIVGWNASEKKAEIWVRVDTVKGSTASQSIKMFWSKSGAPDSSLASSVFNASNGFVSVWHLGNSSNPSDTNARPNAVASAPPATPVSFGGFGTYTAPAGMIGSADTLRGATVNGKTNHDYLSVLNGTAFGGFTGYDAFPNGYTITVWAKPDSNANFTHFMDMNTDDNAPNGTNSIYLGRNGTTAQLAYRNRTGTTSNGGNANANPATDIVSDKKTWQYFSVTKQNAAVLGSLYNGRTAAAVSVVGSNVAIPSASRLYAYMGKSFDATNAGYGGALDEVRVASTTRSADWIALDFETQKTLQTTTDIGVQAPTLAYAPDSATFTQGATISTITPALVGTGVTLTGSLPDGLLLNSTTGAITGTPTGPSAKTKYTITATNLGGSVTDTIFIRVNPAAPTGFAYVRNNLSLLVGTAMMPDTAAVTNLVDSFTVAPSLPAGLSLDAMTGIISGTPSAVSAQTEYVFTAWNVTGTALDTVTILVNPALPIVAYASPKVYVVNTAIDTLAPVSTGGPVVGYAISPNLTTATGLAFDAITGKITGTPTTAAAAANYEIIATNVSGADTAVVNITVNEAVPVISYASPKIFTVGFPATPVSPVSTGGPVTSYAISPNLTTATGLSFSASTGVISGTATTPAAAANYEIIATGPGGHDTAVINITTTNEIPPSITYADSLVAVKGSMIASLTMDTTGLGGGPIDSVAVSPALPAGLSLDKATGTVSGTPTVVSATAAYTFTAYGLGGVDNEVVYITVKDIPPVISYAAGTSTYPVGTSITPVGVSSSGGAVVKYSVSPDLTTLTGLVLDSLTGIISGTPTTGQALTTYVITATNSGGSDTGSVDLIIHGAPVIATQPHDTAIVSGSDASFLVSASAAGALTYQWKKGGVDVSSGGTSATYSLTSATLADTGAYTVVVTSTLNATTTSTTSNVGRLLVNTTPTFTSVQRDTTIASGTNATFTVTTASGQGSSAGTLSYAWSRNGTPVAGAAATLSLTGATIADTGTYSVVVTRSLGTPATTTNATFTAGILRVNAAPVIATQPRDTTFLSGATGTAFSVSASVVGGGTLSYQWKRGATNVGTNAATLALTSVTLADTGSYTVVVTSTLNAVTTSTTSTAAILRVNTAPTFTSVLRDTTVTSGTNAHFTVAAAALGSSTGTLSYQWRKNGVNVAGTAATLTLTGATVADTGTYSVVVTRSLGTPATTTNATFTAGLLRVNAAPTIAAQPRDTTVVAGVAGTFSVSATSVGGGTLSYQWLKNGANVASGGTAATYSTAASAIADTGSYTVVVTSTLNGTTASVTSTAAILRVNTAPTFTSVLRDTTVTSGTAASFTVAAAAGPGSSAGTLSYQWRKNGVNVTGTAATLTLANAAIADTGTYSVVVTRSLGTPATTTNATFTAGALRVNAAPTIAAQPRDTTVVAGVAGTFSVSATSVGGGVLSYQWRKNGTNVASGGTSATYSVSGSAIADTGAYSVVVTSTLNGTTASTTSNAGTLRVNVAPTIATQPAASQTIVVGGNATMTVAAAAGAGSSAGTLSYQWRKNGVNIANGAVTGGATVSGATTASVTLTGLTAADSGVYTVVITRTLNGTMTTVTSANSVLSAPVAIVPDAFVIRVNGQERPYAFQLPAGTTTERLTLSILDVWGRQVWSQTVNPVKDKLTEVSWNGKSANGRQASAGMYVVRISVLNAGKTTNYIRKSVTLKPR
jgi:hypothetical protein